MDIEKTIRQYIYIYISYKSSFSLMAVERYHRNEESLTGV